jgi:flagellar hook protein FlgE
MPQFSIPLSGLDATSAALSTAANNLANLNTVGYKDQQIQFADLFYQNLGTDGAGDPIQQGAGVKVSSEPSNFTQGNVSSTGIDTNVAINGDGFFVVQQNGVNAYTRAGNFQVGTDNLLETADGEQVLGYQATDGAVNLSGGLGTLALGAGTTNPAVVTKNVSLTSNLDASDAPGTSYSTQVTIYDSLGAPHQVTYTYTNADTNPVAGVNSVTAKAATGTLTTAGGGAGNTIVNGSTASVGGVTYTFTTGPVGTTANAVLIGANDTATVGNLVDAINASTSSDPSATGGGAATDFGTNTVANSEVTAAASLNGAFTFTAKTTGATVVPTASSNSGVLSWNGGAGANGVNSVTAQAATGTLTTAGGGAGNTIVNGSTASVGGATYTFTTGPVGTTANAVLIGANDTETVGNLVDAIMNSTTADPSATGGGAATDFGTNTIANTQVTAAASTNGAFTFTAIAGGDITVPTGTSNAGVLSWSAGAGTNGINGVTSQAATGNLATSGGGAGNTIVNGSTASVGGVTYTFTTGPVGTTANAVLIGANDTATIGNLVDAINASTSSDPNATGGGSAADFGTLTTANPQVTAAASNNGAFTFTAKTTGATLVPTATSNSAVLSWNGGAGANGVNAVTGQAAVPAVTNTWTYSVTIPAGDVSGATAPVSLATGTLVFKGDGTLKSITPTGGSATTTNPTITVPPTTTPTSTLADGANPLTFTWHAFDGSGNGLITQTAAASSNTDIKQDGAKSGTLQTFNIGPDGTISGSFSNGQTATLGQIALTSFATEQGLSRNGDNT